MTAIVNQQQAEAWNGWEGKLWADRPDRYNGMMAAFDAPLFEAADIRDGHAVLDVGCGAGLTTRIAAKKAGNGHALGIDLSAPQLKRARFDAAAEGITNIAFERGDAQVHPFDGPGFDVVISRGGVMFFADLVAAFTHLREAMAPAGRLAFVGPRSGDVDSAYARATAALAPYLREPSPAARGMGSLLTPERITEVLTAAGFRDIGIKPVDADMGFGADAVDATDFLFSMAPIQHNLRNVEAASVAGLRDQVRDALGEFETPQGVRIPGGVWLVTAAR
ncbi:class I SAM-dependent methyltransferase [Amycolatopsis sp. CB00013]|uniref:class I SAM-dependent methyltransferase n=1 Tax=Amycolatopsis sp. CB00013 TaxID=1703945 RepID=UPI00093A89C2|nr:class I SAM-dependent methyltransferase [Amycolatopsis sp. CB00013]OKK01752.1 type 11 methyltransferase [Amycolatopsis sp. CB00013]